MWIRRHGGRVMCILVLRRKEGHLMRFSEFSSGTVGEAENRDGSRFDGREVQNLWTGCPYYK
jgi:hypothetical protein